MTHANIWRYHSDMWATAPETEGVACDVSNPVAQALCKYPHLRGLKPSELAHVLHVSALEAQMGILRFAENATGVRIGFQGLSADDAMSMAGQSAQKTSLKYSSDAGSLVDDMIDKAKNHAALIIVLFVVGIILAEAALREE